MSVRGDGVRFRITDPVGHRVFRVAFDGRHAAILAAAFALAFAASVVANVWTIAHARMRVGELRSVTVREHDRLMKIDAQATALGNELRRIERQDAAIGKLFGAHTAVPAHHLRPLSRANDEYSRVAARIDRLRSESGGVRRTGNRLRVLAMHVLNLRRLENFARARALAGIPSLNPAGDVAVRSPFGWRADPWPEFHSGVDLAADYGDSVVAAASGTVTFADYDGGYGYRVEIDHGNGYRTWYCHLSRIDVRLGQRIRKAEHIALVGSTGESTGAHLHYQVMLDGKAVDPAPYLKGVPGKVLASLK